MDLSVILLVISSISIFILCGLICSAAFAIKKIEIAWPPYGPALARHSSR